MLLWNNRATVTFYSCVMMSAIIEAWTIYYVKITYMCVHIFMKTNITYVWETICSHNIDLYILFFPSWRSIFVWHMSHQWLVSSWRVGQKQWDLVRKICAALWGLLRMGNRSVLQMRELVSERNVLVLSTESAFCLEYHKLFYFYYIFSDHIKCFVVIC